jgi:hypothetical protein
VIKVGSFTWILLDMFRVSRVIGDYLGSLLLELVGSSVVNVVIRVVRATSIIKNLRGLLNSVSYSDT